MTLNLIGQKFGEWEVLALHSKSRSGATRYMCLCSCGTEKDVFASHLVQGKSKSCGCKIPRNKERKQWTGYEDISGTQWAAIQGQAKKTAARKKLPFSITIEDIWRLWIVQDKKCALSGIPLTLSTRWRVPGTASLDRIDSGLGYVPGNVQWVHKDVNLMKNRLDQQYFVKLCKRIAEKCDV